MSQTTILGVIRSPQTRASKIVIHPVSGLEAVRHAVASHFSLPGQTSVYEDEARDGARKESGYTDVEPPLKVPHPTVNAYLKPTVRSNTKHCDRHGLECR